VTTSCQSRFYQSRVGSLHSFSYDRGRALGVENAFAIMRIITIVSVPINFDRCGTWKKAFSWYPGG